MAAMAISFFAYLFLFHVLKPSFVMTTKLDGTRVLRRDKASLYSALLAIITAIIVMAISQNTKPLAMESCGKYQCWSD